MSRSRSRSPPRSPSGDRPATAADIAGRLGDGSHRAARGARAWNRELSKYYDNYMNQTRDEYDETARIERDQQNNLRAWLDRDTGYKFFGPRAGWPAYCNSPVSAWQNFRDHTRANEAKEAYDEWDQKRREKSINRERSRSSHSRGGSIKRTKFNKRKFSSRRLLKSRRRTHRK